MRQVTGILSIKSGETYYSLHFAHHGWMAADMVQYIDDLYGNGDPRIGILKLLGYTLEMNQKPPARIADHWVEVDLDNRVLATNSDLIRKVVRQESPSSDDPYHAPSLQRIFEALDQHDYKVELYS